MLQLGQVGGRLAVELNGRRRDARRRQVRLFAARRILVVVTLAILVLRVPRKQKKGPRSNQIPNWGAISWLSTEFSCVSLGFSRFDQVLLQYMKIYLVFPCFLRFYWVLLGFTGFYWVLLGFTRFLKIYTGFLKILLGFTEFLKIFLGFTGFLKILLGFLRFYWVS